MQVSFLLVFRLSQCGPLQMLLSFHLIINQSAVEFLFQTIRDAGMGYSKELFQTTKHTIGAFVMVIEAQENVVWEGPLEVVWYSWTSKQAWPRGLLGSPFRTALEISKEGDSPASLGSLYVHIHCQSGIVHIFQDLCRYETSETSDVL